MPFGLMIELSELHFAFVESISTMAQLYSPDIEINSRVLSYPFISLDSNLWCCFYLI